MFGKASRSFQKKWYEQFQWLEYSIKLDAAFCFACRSFISNPEPSFSVGFKDCKHATGQKGMLTTHSNGKYHTQSVVAWNEYETRVRMGESIGCQFDRLGSKVISDNQKYVLTVMEAILYYAVQGIAFRGHDKSHASLNPGNFKSLVTLLSRHSPQVKHRLQDFRMWLSPSGFSK